MRQFAEKILSLRSMEAVVLCQVDNQQTGVKSEYRANLEARGNSYFVSGMGMEIYSNGVSRWQYLPDVNEVTISKVDTAAANALEQPLRIFEHYEKQFKVRYRGERKEGGQTYADFTLYPRSLGTPYSQIHLSIRKGDLQPMQMTYQGKDGVHYKVIVEDYKPNANVRKEFSFDLSRHKGIEIVDLR